MKNRMTILKSLGLILCAFLVLVLLTACGTSEQEKEAEKLLEEGKYAEAYRIYSELNKKDKMDDVHWKAYEAAYKAYQSGNYDKTVTLLSGFETFKECGELLEEVQGKRESQTVAADIGLDGNNLSFTLIRGKGDKDFLVRIKLYADNASLTGSAMIELKEAELGEGDSIPVQINLADTQWKASKKLGMFLVDAAVTKNTLFIGSKGIRQDGSEGIAAVNTINIEFVDPVKAFTGGTLSIAVYHEGDGGYLETKKYRGETEIQIP